MQSQPAGNPADSFDRASAAALLGEAELVLIDLDGCLTFGDVADPAAARLLDMLAGRFVVLSNNSTDTPHSLSARLDRLGLRVAPDRIMLAGALMVDELAADGREVALFAAPQLADYARASGLRISPEPEILAIARDLTLTFDGLNTMLRHLYNGADLVVSNPDLTHPGEGRVPVVETGALLALLQACLPGLRPHIIGKPEPLMFRRALQRFGVAASRAVMIGDNPATDGLGARRAGIASILVGPNGDHAGVGDLIR